MYPYFLFLFFYLFVCVVAGGGGGGRRKGAHLARAICIAFGSPFCFSPYQKDYTHSIYDVWISRICMNGTSDDEILSDVATWNSCYTMEETSKGISNHIAHTHTHTFALTKQIRIDKKRSGVKRKSIRILIFTIFQWIWAFFSLYVNAIRHLKIIA